MNKIKHSFDMLVNGLKFDVTNRDQLKIVLAMLCEKNSDLIVPIQEFTLENLALARKSALERIKLLQHALSSTVFFESCKSNSKHVAVVRAHWEQAFKGYSLSQFTKCEQDFYLKLCELAPVPMEYCQPVEIGIINDL